MEDQQIISLILDSKTAHQGFDHLMKSYQKNLYYHVRQMVYLHEDTEDVLQNVWIKVFRHLKNFKGDSKLSTWLYKIATNESIDLLNKKSKQNYISVSEYQEKVINNLKTDAYFEGDDITIKLHQSIVKLPEKQQLVFKLRYFNEMSYKEIAALTDTSESALKSSYHFAQKKIEDYLKSI